MGRFDIPSNNDIPPDASNEGDEDAFQKFKKEAHDILASGDSGALIDHMGSAEADKHYDEMFAERSDMEMMDLLNLEAIKRGEKAPFSPEEMKEISKRNHDERMKKAALKNKNKDDKPEDPPTWPSPSNEN